MHYLCSHKTPQTMDTDRTNGTGTLRYSDIFLAMYSDNGMSCLHRNHSHVLVYMYLGELESAVLPVIPEEQAQAAFSDIV